MLPGRFAAVNDCPGTEVGMEESHFKCVFSFLSDQAKITIGGFKHGLVAKLAMKVCIWYFMVCIRKTEATTGIFTLRGVHAKNQRYLLFRPTGTAPCAGTHPW